MTVHKRRDRLHFMNYTVFQDGSVSVRFLNLFFYSLKWTPITRKVRLRFNHSHSWFTPWSAVLPHRQPVSTCRESTGKQSVQIYRSWMKSFFLKLLQKVNGCKNCHNKVGVFWKLSGCCCGWTCTEFGYKVNILNRKLWSWKCLTRCTHYKCAQTVSVFRCRKKYSFTNVRKRVFKMVIFVIPICEVLR